VSNRTESVVSGWSDGVEKLQTASKNSKEKSAKLAEKTTIVLKGNKNPCHYTSRQSPLLFIAQRKQNIIMRTYMKWGTRWL
jgi:hypothetical protein